MYFSGIDLGSSYSKAVIIDENKKIVSDCIRKTGLSFEKISEIVFNAALKKRNISKKEVVSVVTTGVGRNNCPFSDFSKSEISCFAKGCFHYFPGGSIIVDIGGQDNKIIKISENGRQVYFKMNRKCAAGTGSFLEEISIRLGISQKRMNSMAKKAYKSVEIGSYCTVFTCTEIIHHIRTGKNINEILRGVFESVVKRILEMDPFEEKAILTGGVIANNPVIVDIFKEKLEHSFLVPPNPQTIGAFGAAIYAFENYLSSKVS
ncbi:MAG: acyl-CoA dehydratase activase [Acidobacteriota bacterium]